MLAGRPVDTRPATYFTRGEYCRISLSRASGEPDTLYSAQRPASASWAASTSGSRSDWRVALDLAAGAAGPRARCVTAFPIRLAPGWPTKAHCHSDYGAAAMHHTPSDNPLGPSAPRTLAEVDPPPPHPFWLTLLATLSGLVIPAAAAIAAAVLLGSQTVPHSSRAATLAAGALTVAEAIFAGLGAAALVEAGWRRIGLPGSGPATFLPLRWIRHRIAHRNVAALIQRL